MDKKIKAAIAGLAFVAGCEIGIALQLVKMIHDYTVKEAAGKESIEEANSESIEEPNAETVIEDKEEPVASFSEPSHSFN